MSPTVTTSWNATGPPRCSWQSASDSRTAIRRSNQRPERRRQLRERGIRGNEASQRAAQQRTDNRVTEMGFADLGEYLTARHGAGWPTVKISREIGCARGAIADWLAQLALPGPLEPAHPIEVAALARVGQSTLGAFLGAHPAGTSPTMLAEALGHSVAWLRIRARRDGMEDRLSVPPTAEQRATELARDAGFADLPGYLRHRYETDGLSTRDIKEQTGLRSVQIAALLTEAGVERRTDPEHIERQALRHAGWEGGTLADYATSRVAAGWTVQRMSRELGRSDVWVARRLREHGLDHLIGPPGRRK